MLHFPIGLGYIQAMLKSSGIACRLTNLSGMGAQKAAEYIRKKNPKIIGLSLFTYNRKRCFELAKIAKAACPGAIILAGGPHATHLPSETFKSCKELDAIVCGEAEAAMLEIAKRVESGKDWKQSPSLIFRDGTKTPMVAPIEDLDSIGIPIEHFEADFFEDPQRLSYLSTSRGCPSDCSFCNTPEFWGKKIRFRSPASVMREMQFLWQKCGLTYFNFRDDTFTADKQRVLDICKAIEGSSINPLWSCQSRANMIDEERLVAMIRAGCEFIQFGVEHGSEKMLKVLDKGINLEQANNAISLARKVGMIVGIYLITGIPGETMEDVARSEALIEKLLPHDAQVAPLAVYPGTRLYRELMDSGAIPKNFYSKAKDAEVFARRAEKGIMEEMYSKNDPSRLIGLQYTNRVFTGAGWGFVDEHTAKALARLQKAAETVKPKARYTPEDFRRQKKMLGWCATTNMLCGEAAEDMNDFLEARVQYSEIIKNEPQNPWGWMKRGFLAIKTGDLTAALQDVQEALKIVPKSPEALDAHAHLIHTMRRVKK
jgi:anaerobic magnesium-protoporphyrin IX monomethyl ester cyclase